MENSLQAHQGSAKSNLVPIRDNLEEYEKLLAELEQVRYKRSTEDFYKETAYQRQVDGKLSHYYYFSQVKYGYKRRSEVGGYLTHSFDTYQGSFSAQMIRALINYCDLKKGAIIADPFCGSGTTLIEAILLGFIGIGIDINPIACLSSYIKSQLLGYDLDDLIQSNKKYFNFEYYNQFFNTLQRSTFLKLEMTELFYLFLYIRAILAHQKYDIDPYFAFKSLYQDIIKTLKAFDRLKSKLVISLGKVSVICNNNLNVLKRFKKDSVDCIITSPPYISMIDYVGNDLPVLQKFFQKEEISIIKNNQTGRRFKNPEKTLNMFWSDMNNFIGESYRVLKAHSRLILVVGKSNLMEKKCIQIAQNNGFTLDKLILKRYRDFKKNYLKYEYIVIVKK